MRHSFADESVLDVRDYISSKLALYNKAGEDNEDLVVRRIHDGLDPALAGQVKLRSRLNTMANFENQVYNVEHQARAQFYQFQDQINALEPRYEKRFEGLARSMAGTQPRRESPFYTLRNLDRGREATCSAPVWENVPGSSPNPREGHDSGCAPYRTSPTT